MSCSDATDALAAFALDALPAEDRLALLEHLAECRAHDEDLAGYRAVAGRLPLAITPISGPPATLRTSLLDTFDRERAGPAAAGTAATTVAEPLPAEPDTAAAEVVPEKSRPGIVALFQQPALAYGIAAALLIAVLSLTAWNLSMQDDGMAMMQASGSSAGMNLEVEYYMDQQVAVLNLLMPAPPEGTVYQAWMITDGKPVSMGVLDGHAGRMAFAADMAGVTAVAISQEPAGGSDAPTAVKVAAEF